MKLTNFITYVPPMKRFREFWTAKVGQTEGTGKNQQEATANLFETIQKSLDGDSTPSLLFHCGYIALIYKSGIGWFYTIRPVGKSGVVSSNIHYVGDRDETERAARRHLAQYAMDSVAHPEQAAEVFTDEADRRQFIADAYRAKEVQYIMAERGVDWHQANLIFDGLLKEVRYPNANFSSDIMLLDVEHNLVVVKCRLYLGASYEASDKKTEAMKSGPLSTLDKVETAAKARCARDFGISTELALDISEVEEAEDTPTVPPQRSIARKHPCTCTAYARAFSER
jgi:hypothetical protein